MLSVSVLLDCLWYYNWIHILFIIFSISVVFTSIILLCGKKHPIIYSIMCKLSTYGKLDVGLPGSAKFQYPMVQVPKIWFRHFYLNGLSLSTCSLYLFIHLHWLNRPVPWSFIKFLDLLTVPTRQTSVNLNQAVVVLLLYSGHILKRFYENYFLTSESSSKMNILHYLIGHLHYIGSHIGLLSYLPGLAISTEKMTEKQSSIFLSSNFYAIVIGSSIVLIGSLLQFLALKYLADYRKSSSVSSSHYCMPEIGLFDLISCPHMFGEILVYFGLAVIMKFGHPSWNLVLLWVFCNQVQVAVMNHAWYKTHFKDYPLQRKAIFPFLLYSVESSGFQTVTIQFVLKSEAKSLYRKFLREISKLPDEAQRSEMRHWVRSDFEVNKHQSDIYAIRGLLLTGHKRLKELKTTIEMATS